jgi:hypothetical protein
MPARLRVLPIVLLLPLVLGVLVVPGTSAARQQLAPSSASADQAEEPFICEEEGEGGEPDPEREELCGPAASGEWKAKQDTSGGIGLPERALLTAASEAEAIPTVGGDWATEGPDNIGGRVSGLAVDPELADTVYLSAASGGVWKSTDAGTTFTSIWPDDFPQATGAIAAASDGTLYVGTGEASPGGGSLTYEGDGVYRSDDRGRTWEHVGLEASATIGMIAVDPRPRTDLRRGHRIAVPARR